MALSGFGRSGQGSGMFDGIKNKLGLGGNGAYDDGYADEYDEYDEYEEYEDDYEDAPAGSAYDSYQPVTTRSAGSRRRSTYGSTSTGDVTERRTTASHPALVSIDDVRANTPRPRSLSRDTSRRSSSLGRASVGRASDFTPSGAEIDGIPAQERPEEDPIASTTRTARSGGYNSLFDSSPTRAALQPTSKEKSAPGSAVGQGTHTARYNRPTGSYDPYKAYEGTGVSSHAPSRKVIVIAPHEYAEVESVARNLKAGDAVVLSLHDTPNQLSKRILDFSFGVASALDAGVDAIAEKVFAITRGNALTEDEIRDLRSKGVM
ncbi:cell division protein SepF [Denitrobacterium detoxificans]|jgi:cell division inhibitor SepF|uniref:cell division protein SepF n=1 Tax=Denitrobacterium detoxificans TaxID=79604 RepID=UPI0026EA2172|nr:cell division protein SepF [Denitrobacterium detoxificans]MBE6465887.1 cell division protein SepF [Denitrobacterium detoxificans]